MRELENWETVDVSGDTMTFWKCISSDTGQRLTFVVTGTDLEHDEDAIWGSFKSFTIDGREPTTEEEDEHSDDIRALIRLNYSDT